MLNFEIAFVGECRKYAEDSKMIGYLKNNGLLFFKKKKKGKWF
jgi:hypothetical protein